MNDCVNTEAREALPDLLHGRLSALDTATMTAHVETCPDCRAELELLRQVKTDVRLAPRIDVARIAAAIPAYGAVDSLHLPPRQKTILGRISGLRIAVAAVLVAAGAWVLNANDVQLGSERAVASGNSVHVTAVPIQRPPTPSSPLRGTGTSVATPASETQVASLSLVGNTSDLTDADLEQLVAGLDEIEPMPAAEPQSVTPTVEDIGSDEDSGS